VFKNTLARRAAESAGLTELLPLLQGPVAIAFVHGDAVAAAKALRDFGRANPALQIKGGLLGPRVLTTLEVEALADIQPREVLLARLAGGFQAPLANAASLFQAFTRNLAYGVKAYIDQRVEAGEAPPPAPTPTTAGDAVPTDATAAPTEPAAETPAEAEADATDTPEAAAPPEPEPTPAEPSDSADPEEK
jgi:large subunit ribosomal protein L10